MIAAQLDLAQPSAYVTAFAVGTLLHIFLFRIGEWDNDASAIIGTFWGCFAASAAAAVYLSGQSLLESTGIVVAVGILYAAVVCGIFASMLVYRGFFHPLQNFPGPFGSRLSNLYPTFLTLKKMHFFEETEKLHALHGDYVRIGPNTLSIVNPKAVLAMHSNSSPCIKGPWYNLQLPSISLHSTRDQKEHAERRKTWDQGFSSRALRDYEPRVIHFTTQLLEQIKIQQGKPMNVSEQFNLYSFDVMGNLALGKDFEMVKSQALHPAIKLLHGTTKIAGIFSHMSWTLMLVRWLPFLVHELLSFESWLEQQVAERSKNEPAIPDVFSWILRDYEKIPSPTHQQKLDLRGDAKLIVVAGSDTTAASLTCLFLELAINPAAYKKLQSEVDEYFVDHDVPDHVSLGKLLHLQACINESLRLHPAIPSGVQRQTPPEGLQIEDTYIPGNALIQIPVHSLYRDERMFTRPQEYLPERWTTQQDLVRNRNAFAPFSVGRYSCVGKQLALMEMRNVAAQIAHQYDIQLADKNAPAVFHEKIIDGFTITCPQLDIIFTPRKK